MKEYTTHGIYSLSNCAGLKVNIEDGYDPIVHWQLAINDSEKPQRWHKAKIYETTQGRSYFRYGTTRIYLDEVLRV